MSSGCTGKTNGTSRSWPTAPAPRLRIVVRSLQADFARCHRVRPSPPGRDYAADLPALHQVNSDDAVPEPAPREPLGTGRIGVENAGARPTTTARPVGETTEGSEAQWLSTSTPWSVPARRTATRSSSMT